jgi:hypothetical protein
MRCGALNLSPFFNFLFIYPLIVMKQNHEKSGHFVSQIQWTSSTGLTWIALNWLAQPQFFWNWRNIAWNRYWVTSKWACTKLNWSKLFYSSWHEFFDFSFRSWLSWIELSIINMNKSTTANQHKKSFIVHD